MVAACKNHGVFLELQVTIGVLVPVKSMETSGFLI